MRICLSSAQTRLHRHAVTLSRTHRRLESRLIVVLQQVERTRLWRNFDCTSLFTYAVGELELSEPIAYAFIAVARKAALIPALQEAIAVRRLSVATAARIVSCLTMENAGQLIEFAASHTSREIDWEVARRNPKAVEGDRAKPVGDDRIRLTVTVSKAVYEKIRRVEALEMQRGRPNGLESALEAATEEYLTRRDPVRKAKRAADLVVTTATSTVEVCANRVQDRRVPLTASQRHAVHLRDGGRCTHVGHSGKRCNADRWIDVHHIRPVSRGGGNEPGNLTTLCSVHHDVVHQTSFPIEGQVSWLRAGDVRYVG